MLDFPMGIPRGWPFIVKKLGRLGVVSIFGLPLGAHFENVIYFQRREVHDEEYIIQLAYLFYVLV